MSRRPLRALAAAGLLATALSMSGCAQVTDLIGGLRAEAVEVTPKPAASAAADHPFDSQFTYDGSVALSTEVAEGLEVRLDFWAANPKRTSEWTPAADKTFGFAVNVHDHRVDEKAVLTQKRRVYLSQIAITSATTQTSGESASPFAFSADPRTLVPTDTLRNDRGLLLNSFQGGLLVPETVLRELPDDTVGITLRFALTVWVEGAANDDNSFAQQTILQDLPIAIFPPAEATAAD
jgi:hypothetical protein